MHLIAINEKNKKIVMSDRYNYIFNYDSGFFIRWGKTKDDDPIMAPFPEILDIEITTKCTGPGGKLCKFCYKSNTTNGINMSFDIFKNIIDKMKFSNNCIGITQCAIGADATCTSNPDIWRMMEYARECSIIPNITVADVSDEVADKLATVCSAVAISRYDDKNICYDSVKKLTDRGMTQVNIHIMISEETLGNLYETLDDYATDERLSKLNAIVLLSLKQKGRGYNYTPVIQENFNDIVNYVFERKIPIGFDSCSCHKFLKAIKSMDNYKSLAMVSEPCESSCFSAYCNVVGNFFPCSFTENTEDWEDGLSIVDCNDFTKDIWFNEKTNNFRKKLLKNCRNCPIFNV